MGPDDGMTETQKERLDKVEMSIVENGFVIKTYVSFTMPNRKEYVAFTLDDAIIKLREIAKEYNCE